MNGLRRLGRIAAALITPEFAIGNRPFPTAAAPAVISAGNGMQIAWI
jgi:hypothetical protein